MEFGTPEYGLWAEKQERELQAEGRDDDEGLHGLRPDDRIYEWHQRHTEICSQAGMTWPPVFDAGFIAEMKRLRATDRESECIWYLDKSAPMTDILIEEVVMDVSQNLGRIPHSGFAESMPCLLPQGRCFLRRARRWMFGAEYMRVQGYAWA